jgi:hypothetical protein
MNRSQVLIAALLLATLFLGCPDPTQHQSRSKASHEEPLSRGNAPNVGPQGNVTDDERAALEAIKAVVNDRRTWVDPVPVPGMLFDAPR